MAFQIKAIIVWNLQFSLSSFVWPTLYVEDRKRFEFNLGNRIQKLASMNLLRLALYASEKPFIIRIRIHGNWLVSKVLYDPQKNKKCFKDDVSTIHAFSVFVGIALFQYPEIRVEVISSRIFGAKIFPFFTLDRDLWVINLTFLQCSRPFWAYVTKLRHANHKTSFIVVWIRSWSGFFRSSFAALIFYGLEKLHRKTLTMKLLLGKIKGSY